MPHENIHLFLGELLKLAKSGGNDDMAIKPILLSIGDAQGMYGLYGAKLGFVSWIKISYEEEFIPVTSILWSDLYIKLYRLKSVPLSND